MITTESIRITGGGNVSSVTANGRFIAQINKEGAKRFLYRLDFSSGQRALVMPALREVTHDFHQTNLEEIVAAALND